MKIRMTVLTRILFLIAVLTVLSGCGLKYTVKGKVVDAETGEPVEGAVYAVYWYSYTSCDEYYRSACLGCCLLPFGGNPMGPEKCDGEGEDGLTGPDGTFTVLKHTDTESSMAVYKKGYVCWTAYTDYRPELYEEYSAGGIPYEKVRAPRQDGFKIGNGMEIRLLPWKKAYSEAAASDHAKFCEGAYRALREGSDLFGDVIKPEILLLRKHGR